MSESKKNTETAVTYVPDTEANAEEIIAAAKAEAAAIKAKAEAEAAAITEKAKAAVTAEAAADDDKVKIRLFKDNDKYKDDVLVAVNGKTYKIQRGVDVSVPKFVAEVIELSMKQDASTAMMIEREEAAYKDASKIMG